MRRYARRNYKRIGRAALGMAARRYRRTYNTNTKYLRGTTKRRIATASVSNKRKWSRAMGTTSAPSARTKYRHTRYYGQLGLKPGANSSRRFKVESFLSSAIDKALIVDPMVNIEYSDDDTRMNVRHGRLANVTGVKYRIWFNLKNQSEGSTKMNNPIQIRWAILNPKNQEFGSIADVSTTNFFINDTPTTDDASDFPSTATCFRLMNRKINVRQNGVVQEGTFILSNDPASNNTRMSMSSKKLLSLWCPINRQMKWPNNSTGAANRFPQSNLYFTYWFCELGDPTSSKKFPTANDAPFETIKESITYFKDADVLR